MERPDGETPFIITNRSRQDGGLSLEAMFGKMSPSRFQSILIEMAQRVVEKESVGNLLQNYEENRFTKPCSLPQREIINLEDILYQGIPQNYEDVELSPIAPLGTNSLLTGVSQRTVLSTVRNTEVVADPTTILVMECLKRLREENKNEFVIDLCTSARCTRAQMFSKGSGFVPHFKLFALTSGSFTRGETMRSKIIEHLSFYLDFLDRIKINGKYSVNNITVQISNINIMEKLIRTKNLDRLELGKHSQDNKFDPFLNYNISLPSNVSNLDELENLAIKEYQLERYTRELSDLSEQVKRIEETFPEVKIRYDLARIAGIGYYNGVCLKITAENSRGEKYPLVDGGYSDWLTKLTTNQRAAFCSSGFGLELFGNLFKT